MENKITFIYALIDPDTREIKYVGQTRCLEDRYAQHLRDKSNAEKYNWVISLKAKGILPDMVVLEKIKYQAPPFMLAIRERIWALKAIDSGNVIFNKPKLIHRQVNVVYEMLIGNNESNNEKWIIKP